MIGLHNLKPAPGSHHRRKIVGRGVGSGHGRTSTRGGKGQTARSGHTKMTGFEGGQMPLVRRIPKRGFTNRFRWEYETVNVESLNSAFDAGSEITPETLKAQRIVNNTDHVKILGDGEITRAFTVKAQAFSKSAIEKITAAGGKVEKLKK